MTTGARQSTPPWPDAAPPGRILSNGWVVRTASVLLGGLPSLLLAVFAIMIGATGIENLFYDGAFVDGLLLVVWATAGLLGTVSGWLAIFDVGVRRPRVVIALRAGIVTGILAALPVALFDDWRGLLVIALLPVGVGLYHLVRLTQAARLRHAGS